jgi:hypothetical protein
VKDEAVLTGAREERIGEHAAQRLTLHLPRAARPGSRTRRRRC